MLMIPELPLARPDIYTNDRAPANNITYRRLHARIRARRVINSCNVCTLLGNILDDVQDGRT